MVSLDIQPNILIVDDDEDILSMLHLTFKKEKFTNITLCTNAEEGLELVKTSNFNLILLDVMLPGKSGFEILPSIRDCSDAPVFFLTAKDTDFDKLTGFAFGADDYITKPFNPLEVVARSKAILKRTIHAKPTKNEAEEKIDFGYFRVDKRAAELIVDGETKECSAQLFQLLVFFCEHAGRVLTREQIYEHVWGSKGSFIDDNTIIVHIHKLREKIEPTPSKPVFLKTVRGLGYKMVKAE
ncbi:response regulator transcription factor [Halobacillus sp. A5]|uniref:response regulator transcription factor n=1 Tax=Halobacillus sp. A5 TaxID=2880263 RepID=UPI0020A68E39|nr:response regulator transcription factor [Halobacillus sp. A5]MCP3029631.1 response regulator transcription factor [Halobacillus sp. A5]